MRHCDGDIEGGERRRKEGPHDNLLRCGGLRWATVTHPYGLLSEFLRASPLDADGRYGYSDYREKSRYVTAEDLVPRRRGDAPHVLPH